MAGLRTCALHFAGCAKSYFEDNRPREPETFIKTVRFEWFDVLHVVAHFLGVEAYHLIGFVQAFTLAARVRTHLCCERP